MNDVLLHELIFLDDISYNINDIDTFDTILDEKILLDDDVMNINDRDKFDSILDEKILLDDIDKFDSILDEKILLDDDVMNINDIDTLIFVEDYSIYKQQEICCLCGVSKQKHAARRHKYIQIKKEYRCKKCSLFFFQHDHIKQPCFTPFKYIS